MEPDDEPMGVHLCRAMTDRHGADIITSYGRREIPSSSQSAYPGTTQAHARGSGAGCECDGLGQTIRREQGEAERAIAGRGCAEANGEN